MWMRLAPTINTMHESMDKKAIRGHYPVYHLLLERGPRVYAIASMSTDGVIAVDLHKGSVNGDVFHQRKPYSKHATI